MPDWIEILLRSFFFLIVLFLITKVLGKNNCPSFPF